MINLTTIWVLFFFLTCFATARMVNNEGITANAYAGFIVGAFVLSGLLTILQAFFEAWTMVFKLWGTAVERWWRG